MNAAPKIRTAYHHGDLKEALLKAADSLLADEGVQGLTLRACARKAGVSHAAPKHHFTDVSALLSEVAARSFDKLTKALKAAREEASGDPEERFIAVFRTYVVFARAFPDHFRLMFRWDAMSHDNEALRGAATRTFAEMTSSITVQRGDADVTAQTLEARIQERGLQTDVLLGWSQIHGYAQLLLEGQFDGFADTEGMDAFVERTVVENGARISRALKSS